MTTVPEPGDRVRVPFGFHVLEGVVQRVSVSGIGVRVTVEVEIDGADEPIVSTYPLDAVEMATAA